MRFVDSKKKAFSLKSENTMEQFFEKYSTSVECATIYFLKSYKIHDYICCSSEFDAEKCPKSCSVIYSYDSMILNHKKSTFTPETTSTHTDRAVHKYNDNNNQNNNFIYNLTMITHSSLHEVIGQQIYLAKSSFEYTKCALELCRNVSAADFGISVLMWYFPKLYSSNSMFLFEYKFSRFENFPKLVSLILGASKNGPMKEILFDSLYGFQQNNWNGVHLLDCKKLNYWLLNAKTITPIEFVQALKDLQPFIVVFFYFIFTNKISM